MFSLYTFATYLDLKLMKFHDSISIYSYPFNILLFFCTVEIYFV